MEYPVDKNIDREIGGVGGLLEGNIEIKNITFGYNKLDKPVISDFSLKAEKGQTIAIVGGSGSGKSTLSKLISGLYGVWSGEILYDGKRIDEIDHEVFVASVAVVDQDIVLFNDTIENNIKMWDKTITDEEMVRAAKDALIYDLIMSKEYKFREKLLEGGKNISGGERQRIEIARALAGEPSIIILDEATSALDAKTEHEVVKAIKARGITCIVIAHRLSTIRDADNIIVLNKGQITEQGRHEELMQNHGYYYDLIRNE
jgi:ABC-type multidrug transport system fused ATPase/permease subunit